MSKLIKPYEISIWDDVWDAKKGKFIEKRYAVIGSDTMTSQNRVLEPSLTKGVNGTKKLTFKLCRKYKDNKTGLDTVNPFADFLVSERKVKLHYKDKWYDFIVKNVVEDSSKYIYTYQLEDALVTELSKNGFGVILDTEKENNTGNIKTLAERVLEDTDWKVKSDLIVQTIEESLVYVRIPAGTTLTQIRDPKDNSTGTEDDDILLLSEDSLGLAFYSSCRNQPYRFQLIYLDPIKYNNYSKDLVQVDKNQIIQVPNCQYYIDFPTPQYYQSAENDYGLVLPIGWDVYQMGNDLEDLHDTTISNWYRGARYVQGQETKFSPALQKYVNIYDKNGLEYYGYVESEFVSPELIDNIITNANFKTSDGWIGTRSIKDVEKATAENVYGRFNGNDFISALQEIGSESFDVEKYQPYMHLDFPNENALVVNSGPHDNRFAIGYFEVGSEWKLKVTYQTRGQQRLGFGLKECEYNVKDDCYKEKDNSKVAFNSTETLTKITENDWNTVVHEETFAVIQNTYSGKKDYKNNSSVRLTFNSSEAGEYYITSIQLFRVVRDENGNIITPDDNLNNINSINCINYKYYYFLPEETNKIADPDDFVPSQVYKTPQNEIYKPKLISTSEKIGTVSAKESNYFNILQSIAETFEAWLGLEVERDSTGAITSKWVTFRKQLGTTNYANFRYGVNLKDIKRTYESKQIVTKLIVKNNSNEFAKNGFCTIMRAKANPLGENYIYDLRYYFNQGMLSAKDYLNVLYSYTGYDEHGEKIEASGLDIPNSPVDANGHVITNIYGYYPRLRILNDEIETLNEKIIGVYLAKTKLQAEYEVAKNTKEAAKQSIEEVIIAFKKVTEKEITEPLDEIQQELSEVIKYRQQYVTYQFNYNEAEVECTRLNDTIEGIESNISDLEKQINNKLNAKKELNKAFYSQYSRFIQEGTWIDEKYVDDEKYYNDALSVAYNSCYPKVAYSINVLSLSGLPGYELFEFNLGDKTFVEDPDFFGNENKEEVVITEITEYLDQPEKNTIKVQNFKNQFQDLFQKITATVQQTQYNTGSYEKAVALAEASSARKQAFLTDALSAANTMLTTAGQQSVTWGADGITVTDLDTPSNTLRLIGGAILLSKQNANGIQEWTTGITSQGVSASLITAGLVNTKEIQIMNYDKPTFRWDSMGISAFQLTTQEGEVSKVNFGKFVRFDQYGIYGIENADSSWYATNITDIEDKGNFALTWEGLFVKTGEARVHIGKEAGKIISVVRNNNGEEKDSFYIDLNGQAFFDGSINVGGVFTVSNTGVVSITEGSIRLGYNENLSNYNFVVEDSGEVQIRHGSISLGYDENLSNYNFCATDDGELKVGCFNGGYNFQVTPEGTVNIAKNLNIGKYTDTEKNSTEYYFKVDESGKVAIEGTIYATNGTLGQLIVIGQLKVGESKDGAAYYIGGTEGDSYLNLPNMILNKEGLLTVNNIRAAGGDLLDLNIRGLLKFPALGEDYYINGVSSEDAEEREDDFKVTYASLIRLPGFSILNPLYWPGDAETRIYLKGSVCFQVSESDSDQIRALYLRSVNNFNCLISNRSWTGSFTDAPDGESCCALSLSESTGVLTFRNTSQVGYFNSGGAHFKTSNQYLYYANDGIYIYNPKKLNSPVGKITLTPSAIELYNDASSIQISSSGIKLTNIATMSGGVWDALIEKVKGLEQDIKDLKTDISDLQSQIDSMKSSQES